MLTAAVMFLPCFLLAQTVKDFKPALEAGERQIDNNLAELEALGSDSSRAAEASFHTIGLSSRRYAKAHDRSAGEPAAPAAVFDVDFSLNPDALYRVKDSAGQLGLVLTGRLVSDYAQKCQLIPAYEKTVSDYRTHANLQKSLITQMDTTITLQSRKIDLLQEHVGLLEINVELYKKISELKQGSIWEKFLRKIAFPAGLAAGIIAGASLPR